MEFKDFDGYEKQRQLLDRFITNGGTIAFKRMFNDKSKPVKPKIPNRNKFAYSFQLGHSHNSTKPMNRRKSKLNDYNINTESGNIYTQKYDFPELEGTYNDGNLNNFRLEIRDMLIQDPELKGKSMKGNHQWGTMKFNLMKMNWAKRRGISIDQFQIPKIESFKNKKSMMEINGTKVIADLLHNGRRKQFSVPGSNANNNKL